MNSRHFREMVASQSYWNYTLDDTSPVFRYKPYADGIGISNGWEAWYGDSGFLTHPGEGPGEGTSYHVTSLSGASVHLSFFGTGISLYGIANCTYKVTLDGVRKASDSTPSSVLFSEYNLNEGIHNITLTTQISEENQLLQFDGAQITSIIPDFGISGPNTLRIDNQHTSAIEYRGNWTVRQDSKVPTRYNPSPYFWTRSGGASASMNFTGRAVEVRGISNWGWWDYLVTLDGKVISGMNASSFWIIPDAVLFFQDGLDESSTHNLIITNSAEDGMNLAVNSITIYHFDKSTSTSSPLSSDADQVDSNGLSAGQTAGIIVGAFIISALIAFAAF